MSSSLESSVRHEIEALHEFFVGWFSGALDETRFESDFLSRMDPGFVLIPPAGVVIGLDHLQADLRKGHGSNPDFRIAIRNVSVRRRWDDHVLVTYEEWQRNALASTPPDNARISTALLRQSDGFSWLHVHETWMPEAVMSEGPYDF